MQETVTRYVGIDLHRSVIAICILGEGGEVVEERMFRGSSLSAGIKAVEHLAQEKERSRYVVEALGLNRWFVNACRERGMDMVVADPFQLKLRASGKKTDRRDAHELARRLRLGDIDTNALTYYCPEPAFGKKQLVRARRDLIRVRQTCINHIRSLLNAYRLDIPGRLYGPRGMARLAALEMPTPEQTVVLRTWVKQMEAVHQQIEALQVQVETQVDHPQCQHLMPAPQMGAVTAVTIVGEFGDVRRFRSSREAASFTGLVPRVFQSGDKAYHGHVTKKGNRQLRWMFCQWAVRLMATNPLAQQWAGPKLRRMAKNKVRVALARRLAVGAYYSLLHNVTFDLERCLMPSG